MVEAAVIPPMSRLAGSPCFSAIRRFYDPNQPTYGTPRSSYMLMSAGKDGVYLGRYDGPVDDTGSFDFDEDNATHEDLDSFDDVVVYGGG